MNSEQERPFVCSAPGCSQRFPTEDHLMIHRHKHEMTLKFPSIKIDSMLSDQTPTPTRFLKNCEEVGLFSELDCSIEQEFRKAQEEEDNKQVDKMTTVSLLTSGSGFGCGSCLCDSGHPGHVQPPQSPQSGGLAFMVEELCSVS
uniref:cAMP responsive element binding protein 5b n=1 Tax=Oncorhynchus tshawytscha TaxID=74940 RepID=A0AAZ3SVS0_ONCTS